MKVIFFGTPFIAAKVLEYLVDQVEICAVVTQPDKPRGRSQKVSYSPVKIVAKEKLNHVPIFQPKKASDPGFIQKIQELKADLLIVLGYGQILKKDLLDACKIIPINIHTSLLPAYRGAAPMQRCLMDGVSETGVTIMQMDQGMDTGDVLAQKKIDVPLDMTMGDLESVMTEISGPLLMGVIEKKQFTGQKQNHKDATYAKKLGVDEFEVSWNFPAKKIHNQIRAFSPKPGAWCFIHINNEKKRVKILRSMPCEKSGAVREILVSDKKLIVGCGEGSLEIFELQLEGKKAVPVSAFLNGFNGKFFF